MSTRFALTFLMILTGGLARGAESPAFELRDGDRVVLLGNTLIEREQQSGYWETMLTAAYPDRHITFRNLGWDGDTVWAESRGYFDAPQVGYQRMLDQIKDIQPTVIILAYGNNEAYAGEAGLSAFLEQYSRLIDDLTKVSAEGVRFVMLSPVPHKPLPAPLPDRAKINANIAVYNDALATLAHERDIPFIQLTIPKRMDSLADAPVLTNNGLHWTPVGYEELGRQLLHGLGLEPPARVDEELRQAVIAKNELYFHHWRPQNITYLFGFRKHEQGQNAREVEVFKQLVAEQDAAITKLKQK